MVRSSRYVFSAVLDVMGYKDGIENDKITGSFDFGEKLQKSMNRAFIDFNIADYYYEGVCDTIIVICAKKETFIDFLMKLREIVLIFLEEGIFLRGAITYGKHFRNPQNFFTYSQAMTRSRELEKTFAIYPRILIDHNIIDMYYYNGKLKLLVDTKLINSLNGVHFLNIITDKKTWRKVYNFGSKIFENDLKQLIGNDQKFSKHVWFEDYLFFSDFKIKSNKMSRYIPRSQYLDLQYKPRINAESTD